LLESGDSTLGDGINKREEDREGKGERERVKEGGKESKDSMADMVSMVSQSPQLSQKYMIHLPDETKACIIRATQRHVMEDQTISNVLYGLYLMGARWSKLEPVLRSTLLASLHSPSVFYEDVPQHVSNSLFALSKMDCPWSELPSEQIQEAFVRCSGSMSPQETSNSIYGMNAMGAAWMQFLPATRKALANAIIAACEGSNLTAQEHANLCYSVATLTFDSHFAFEAATRRKDEPKAAELVAKKLDLPLLWAIHNALIGSFPRTMTKNPETMNLGTDFSSLFNIYI